MHRYQIILVSLPLAAWSGCKPWAPPQYQGAAPPVLVQEYPTTGSTQPFLQPTPVIVEPGVGPVFPSPSAGVPLAGQMPGSVFGPPLGAPPGPLSDIAPGGAVSPQFGLPSGPEAMPPVVSSISVPVTNDEWAWDQITDVVSEYFTITGENPARRGPDVAMEGRIETAPQDGATILEPHRNDSVGRFNRWESTFQSIRRRASIRVIPTGPNYTIEVAVQKELEDLPHPEQATAGSATFRNDGSLNVDRPDRLEPVSRTRSSPRWIVLGRDPPLEQRMLSEMHARLTGVATGATPVFPR